MKTEARPAILVMMVIMGIFMLLSVIFSSCTSCSQSGRRVAIANQPKAEKVVIIDALPVIYGDDITSVTYKVKRIEVGVVCWARVINTPLFEIGDTILYKFQ